MKIKFDSQYFCKYICFGKSKKLCRVLPFFSSILLGHVEWFHDYQRWMNPLALVGCYFISIKCVNCK